MKKVILGVFAAILASVGGVAPTVSAAPASTVITGVVTLNHMAVPGAMVSTVCGGSVQADTSDGQGAYLVSYPTAQCPFGSTVKVTAQKDGKSGVSSGTVQGITTKLNLAIVNVAIPEFGMTGTLLAGAAGIGLISYIRRRQQEQV